MRHAPPLAAVLAVTLACLAVPAGAQVADPRLWTTDGVVNTSFLDGNKLYVGGDFSYLGPQTGAWASVSRADYRPYPAPRIEGTVYCSASDGAGGWFVGGSFTRIGGAPRQNLAHFRADGTLDGWAPNPSAPVRALLRVNAKLYVGGEFTTIAGSARARLAAFDLGTLSLTSWNPSAVGGAVLALAESGARIYAGGDFTQVGAASRNRIAAMDTLLGTVVAWDPNSNGSVRAIVATPSRVYAGGTFTSVGGAARNRIAAISPATAAALSFHPNAGSDVNALVLRGPALYAVGAFANIAGVARSSAAALDTALATATAWAPALNGVVHALTFDGQNAYLGGSFLVPESGTLFKQNMMVVDAVGAGTLRSAASPSNGVVYTLQCGSVELFAGGAFTSFGGVRRTHLAALDLASGRATDWAPQASDPVLAVVRGGAHVYAGGRFTRVGGATRFFVAQLDTVVGAATAWDANPDSAVWCLAYGNGVLYMGGTFRAVKLLTNARNRLAAVDLVTGAPTAFHPNVISSGSAYTYVNTMHLFGSTLYFGGKFTQVGTAIRANLAAVDASTGAWNGWRPPSDKVKQVQRVGERVYVANDNPGAPGYFFMSDTTGPGIYPDDWFPDSAVATFAISGSKIYFGGGFNVLYNDVRKGLGESLLGSYTNTSWNPSPDVRDVRTLALWDSKVVAGGAFSAMGQRPVRGLAMIWPAPAAAPTVTVLTPNGGERLRRGTTYRVTWAAAAPGPGVQSVDVSLSTAGTGGPWTVVGAGVPNTGTYAFVVPMSAVPGTGGYIRVEARDWAGQLTGDRSDAAFTFDNGTLDAPEGPVAAFTLDPIAPNPARAATPVRFALPHGAAVRVSVLDVQGREVRVLADGEFGPGRHAVTLEGSQLAAGLYFVRVKSGGLALTRRVAIVR